MYAKVLHCAHFVYRELKTHIFVYRLPKTSLVFWNHRKITWFGSVTRHDSLLKAVIQSIVGGKQCNLNIESIQHHQWIDKHKHPGDIHMSCGNIQTCVMAHFTTTEEKYPGIWASLLQKNSTSTDVNDVHSESW